MSPATWPRDNPLAERLLIIDPRADSFDDARVGSLPKLLSRGDLLVVNDAATFPASLCGRTRRTRDGDAIEVRLLGQLPTGAWSAVLFGAGDWRTRTEDRPPPPHVAPFSTLDFDGLGAVVESIARSSDRLVTLRFDREGDALWSAIYRVGVPVQYAYIDGPLALWHVQTPYAARPWAAELPSAGRPLTWGLLGELTRKGIQIATLTHAAGLSSTGDPALDALLPLPERFDIREATVDAIATTKKNGGRVIAVGTTVVRALEGCAALHGGELHAGEGLTDLRIGEGFRPRIVDGIFTGLHERSATHFMLLSAFAPYALLDRAYAHAENSGYLGHEFGDSNLILPQ